MSPVLDFVTIDPTNHDHLHTVVELWNQACGTDLAISPRLAAHNLRPSVGGAQMATFAFVEDRPVGFISASTMNDPAVTRPHSGWIDAIAVAPDVQSQGIGAALLQWAEQWHASQDTSQITIGGSPRHFLPGVPDALNTLGFFQHYGYGSAPDQLQQQWDVAADLARYKPPRIVREIEGIVRPAQPHDYALLQEFLQREFPRRWRYDFEQYVAEGGRISDFMVLWTERGIDGCCALTFEDSHQPIERYFPYRLPRPWGQLGSIGISADRRGEGLGAALLDASLRRLHNNGVNGCIIDWTDLLEFYAKFGFSPYRMYHIPEKHL